MEFWYIIEISFLLNIAYRELKSPKNAKDLQKRKKSPKTANQGTAPTGLFLNYF